MTYYYYDNHWHLGVFFPGGRPKLEELSFDEGVQNERFQIVKQLFEACWNEEFDRRPTMEKVLSCFFVDEENNLKLSPLYGSK